MAESETGYTCTVYKYSVGEQEHWVLLLGKVTFLQMAGWLFVATYRDTSLDNIRNAFFERVLNEANSRNLYPVTIRQEGEIVSAVLKKREV